MGKPKPQQIMSLVFIAEFLFLGQVQTQRRKLRGRLPPEKKFYMKFWKWVGNEESERRLVKRQQRVEAGLIIQMIFPTRILNVT